MLSEGFPTHEWTKRFAHVEFPLTCRNGELLELFGPIGLPSALSSRGDGPEFGLREGLPRPKACDEKSEDPTLIPGPVRVASASHFLSEAPAVSLGDERFECKNVYSAGELHILIQAPASVEGAQFPSSATEH